MPRQASTAAAIPASNTSHATGTNGAAARSRSSDRSAACVARARAEAWSNLANAALAAPAPVADATAWSCWPPSSRARSFLCSARYARKVVAVYASALPAEASARSRAMATDAAPEAVLNRSSNGAPDPRAIRVSASALLASKPPMRALASPTVWR
jgi:hypothetical protein